MNEPIHIWTDGSAQPNPGPGGWAYLKRWQGKEKAVSGQVNGETTNNRMEMIAVIQALRSLTRPDVPVVVFTDSDLIVKGMNEWMPGWIAKGWRNSQRKPVENRELWEALKALANARGPEAAISFQWVPGHKGHLENERADKLASAAARRAAKAAGDHPWMPTAFDPAAGLIVSQFDVGEAA